ncbi:hypothetical protein Pmani_024293 [Petrolisthes manimaculis]|uniref:BZIP domain-containing protein n=1 Tax=Petrolisthes manimaculis TaxID=1843537 RepID=A0AAE1PA44_9EUCA|nr:hypothetical protein Pmani_024293 [Petrolisthes manimaculis]
MAAGQVCHRMLFATIGCVRLLGGKSGGSKEGEEKKDGAEWEQYNAGAAFLGPTLWDKTLTYDSDLKLEYMDLDEFLNENGIPIEEGGKGGPNARTSATAPSSGSSGGGGRGGGTSGPGQGPAPVVGGSSTAGDLGSIGMSPADPTTPQSPPPTAEVLVGTGMGAAPHMPSVPVPQSQAQPPMTVCPPTLSPLDYNSDDYCSSSPDDSDPNSPSLQVHEPEIRASLGRDLVRLNHPNKHLVRSSSTASINSDVRDDDDDDDDDDVLLGETYSTVIDFQVSPNDLALATVPGKNFDPRTRCFTEDELKPQPMIKKSRKQFVPMEMKDDKYWARRRKNNLAAKRSRDARRLKENQIAMRANFLEKENNALSCVTPTSPIITSTRNVGLRVQLDKVARELDCLRTRLAKYE